MDVSDLHLLPAETPKHSNTIQEGTKGDTNDAEAWPVYQKLLEEPIVFAVMGVTGSGKSNLIKLTGAKRQVLSSQEAQRPMVGHKMESETRDLEVYELYHNTRRILLVDTPGFNNSGKGDAEILEMLAAWFSTCYYLKKALAGVIYLYPITDDMRASTLKNLDLLQKLCGSDAMKTVTFITTMWDKNFSQKEQAYLNREKFLIEKSWLTMTHHGAVVLRSHNKKTDMPGLLDSILRQSSPVTLAVQIQLVDRKLKLADTDPGKVLIHDIRTPPTVLESWKRERSRLLAKGQDLGDQDLSYLDFLNFYIAAVEPGNEEHAAKRLETWTFESVLNDIFDTAILGGAGAGFYGADHDIYLGALAVRLTPGIAVAVASAGGLGAMGALVNRSGADPPENTKGLATKMINPGDQELTKSRIVEPMKISTLVGTPSLRLSNPTQYFEELEELEQAVFEQSGIAGYAAAVADPQPGYVSSTQAHHAHDDTATVKDQLDDLETVDHTDLIDQSKDESVTKDSMRIPARRVPILPCSPPGLQESTERLENLYLNLFYGSAEEPFICRKLFHLLECRNVAQRILWNICRLQRAGYISDRISLVTMDKGRENVACLKSISMRQIEELIDAFTVSANAASINETVDYQRLTSTSKEFLTSVDLSRQFEAQERKSIGKPSGRDTDPFIWRCAIHTLDLAVLLYTGTHTASMRDRYPNSPISSFRVPGSYIESEFLTSANYASIVCQRRLQCLDGLLDGVGVWVFHSDSGKSPDPDLNTPPLHLATESKTLADIWGPMWEERVEGETLRPPQIRRYKIGNGSIVPWSPSEVVKLSNHEVYCHWISDSGKKDVGAALNTRFEGSEVLVIGATPDFKVNESCPRKDNPDGVITNLRHAHRITSLTTAVDTWLPDTKSQAVQGGIAHYAISNITITRSYKLKPGQTWKRALLEVWDPANEDGEPLGLELYMGLEISLCTENASRVTVSSVLLSESMRRFFDPPTPNDFMEALEPRRHEPNIIQLLWRDHPEWHKDICKSVYRCLKALECTGLMNERRDPRFHALWNPGSNIPASKISFRKCGWMDMLSESVRNGCVAVVVTECLKSDHKDLRRCQAHLGPNDKLEGKSALRTSFTLSESEKPFGLMVMGTGHWLCTTKCKGKVFTLSHQGVWQVVGVLDGQTDKHGLLMEGKRAMPLSKWKRVKVIEFDGSDRSNPPLPVLLY